MGMTAHAQPAKSWVNSLQSLMTLLVVVDTMPRGHPTAMSLKRKETKLLRAFLLCFNADWNLLVDRNVRDHELVERPSKRLPLDQNKEC